VQVHALHARVPGMQYQTCLFYRRALVCAYALPLHTSKPHTFNPHHHYTPHPPPVHATPRTRPPSPLVALVATRRWASARRGVDGRGRCHSVRTLHVHRASDTRRTVYVQCAHAVVTTVSAHTSVRTHLVATSATSGDVCAQTYVRRRWCVRPPRHPPPTASRIGRSWWRVTRWTHGLGSGTWYGST